QVVQPTFDQAGRITQREPLGSQHDAALRRRCAGEHHQWSRSQVERIPHVDEHRVAWLEPQARAHAVEQAVDEFKLAGEQSLVALVRWLPRDGRARACVMILPAAAMKTYASCLTDD